MDSSPSTRSPPGRARRTRIDRIKSPERLGRRHANHFGAGKGLSGLALFFTLSASLFSGYTVEGIAGGVVEGMVRHAMDSRGVGAVRWAFGHGARLNALGKSSRYLTLSEFVYDRFSALNSRNQATAHALRVLTWGSLVANLCYHPHLCRWVKSSRLLTNGAISEHGGILIFALIMFVVESIGGLRAVAYTDIIQGIRSSLGL